MSGHAPITEVNECHFETVKKGRGELDQLQCSIISWLSQTGWRRGPLSKVNSCHLENFNMDISTFWNACSPYSTHPGNKEISEKNYCDLCTMYSIASTRIWTIAFSIWATYCDVVIAKYLKMASLHFHSTAEPSDVGTQLGGWDDVYSNPANLITDKIIVIKSKHVKKWHHHWM